MRKSASVSDKSREGNVAQAGKASRDFDRIIG